MEGIETAGQEEAVLEIGGRLAQGYRYYKPMPEAALLELWEREAARAA